MNRPKLVDRAGAPIAAKVEPGAHHVLMIFPDDHNIGGGKVSIIGVTPEQIAIAIMYLGRAMDRMMDAAEIMRMRADDETRLAQAAVEAERGKVQ